MHTYKNMQNPYHIKKEHIKCLLKFFTSAVHEEYIETNRMSF